MSTDQHIPVVFQREDGSEVVIPMSVTINRPKPRQKRRSPRFVIALALFLVVTAGAAAGVAHASRYYVPRVHHRCKSGYVRRTVRVRARRHGKIVRRHGRIVWIRQARCVRVPAKPTLPAPTAPKPTSPAPTLPAPAPVAYSTHVDPSFTQSPANPLAVTYSYDASAFAGQTNLGAVGQLPAGVLNFYSPTTPGQPAGLVCSMNVGGAVTGGTCPVSYTATGTYQVTTEYVPNAANAVTETDTETISPYATSTSVSTNIGSPGPGDNWFLIGVNGLVSDPSGAFVAQGQPLTYTITDMTTGTGIASFTEPAGQFCTVLATVNPPSFGTMTFSSGSCVLNSVTVPAGDTYAIAATFGGTTGYLPSASAQQTF